MSYIQQGACPNTRVCPFGKHTFCWRACTCPLCLDTPTPLAGTRRKAETFAAPSMAAQNKQRWSSLLLGISLRAGARASVGGGELGVFWWLQSYKYAPSMCRPAFVLGLVQDHGRVISLMHGVQELPSVPRCWLQNPTLSINWDETRCCGPQPPHSVAEDMNLFWIELLCRFWFTLEPS